MRPVLVLRPEPGTSATVRRAVALGLEAVPAPLFSIVPVAWDASDPADHDALMLTSANAVRHAGSTLALYAGLPVYAVGAATADAARAAGLTDVRTGPGDAAALLELMVREGVARPLHLSGREFRDEGVPALAITRRAVYAADPVPALPGAARAALNRDSVALIHSPRAGAVFARLLASAAIDPSAINVAAISHAAAQGPWRHSAIAAAPDDSALLAAALSLCEKG